jgi:hypothetical protein
MKNIKIVIMMIVGATFLGGCAATKQARSVEASGFLGEYRSRLQPGKEVNGVQQVLLVYIKPNLSLKGYNKILLEPISIWVDPTIEMSSEQRNDLQQVADSAYVTLSEKLSKDWQMVDKSGLGTVRVQVAIINAEKHTPGLSFISKAIPQARLLNSLWSFGAGKPAFTGEVHMEAKMTDAETGELLAAAADKRVGGQKLFEKNVFDSWGDVKNAFEYWGDLFVFRVCQYREGTDCVKPKA